MPVFRERLRFLERFNPPCFGALGLAHSLTVGDIGILPQFLKIFAEDLFVLFQSEVLANVAF